MNPCCHPAVGEGVVSIDVAFLFLAGVTMSLGHCLGMCGPIQAAFSLEQRRAGAHGTRFIPPLLRYHLGRILSYTLIGAAFGLVGSATRFSGAAAQLQGGLAIGAGLLMLVVGAGILGMGPSLNWGIPDAWGRPVGAWVSRLLGARGWYRQFLLGMANGFLPCGPVLAMAISAAAAAHVGFGMVLMGAYGLGTLPALAVFAFMSSRLGAEVRQRFYRVGAILVVLVGVQLGLRGLAALGVIEHLRFGQVVIW